MSPQMFIVVLVLSIAALMLLIVKAKLHPTFSLFIVALFVGIAINLPVMQTIGFITVGFGATMQSIGIPIILGAILAMGIQDTGAAVSIANFFIKRFGGKNLELAPGLTAYVVSIPVFGDITMMLTSNIANVLSKRTRHSMASMATFAGLALFLTHALVPPTPGILALSLLLGADLGMVILWGIVVTFVVFIAIWFMLRNWTKKEYIEPINDLVANIPESGSGNVEDLLVKKDDLPHPFAAFMTVFIPVFLLTGSSIINLSVAEDAPIRALAALMGDRIVALGIGVIYTMFLGIAHKSSVIASNASIMGKENILREVLLQDWIVRGLKISFTVIVITAMGGAFSQVIRNAPAINELSVMIQHSPIPGILIPFLISVIMMSSVGSMTVAGMTAAALVLPMMGGLGITPVAAALAIGAGSMTINHVNNSGFWVMSQFFNLNTQQAFKYVTIPCAIASVLCIILIAVFSGIGLF